VWKEISDRRAANMRTFITDVNTTHALREDLTVEQAADIVWTLNSSDVYLLLTEERGWSPEEFERWLADGWIRLLLH
jgi:prophage antirepressor-like protein